MILFLYFRDKPICSPPLRDKDWWGNLQVLQPTGPQGQALWSVSFSFDVPKSLVLSHFFQAQ